MNWKTVAVLIILAAGLGGFYVYDIYRLTPSREKQEQVKGRLWDVEPKDVEMITIQRKSDTVRVKRVEGGWEMLEPVKARADRAVVDEVVSSLATLRMDREIDPNPAKLTEFGLEPPATQVTLEVKGRSEPLRLALGEKNPTGAWVYGREGSKPAVMALSEIAARDTARPVADFRDKAVLAFERKNVTGLELDVGGQRITVGQEEAGRWQITQPGPYPADADLITGFLDKLSIAKVKEFVTEAARSPAEYGLDRPAAVTLVLGRDKDRTTKGLLFGRVDKDKSGVYVGRAGEPAVMLVADDLWTGLPKTVAALRDKVVLAYAYDKVNRIEVESPRGKVTVERDGPGWKVTSPEAAKADTGEVNGFLWKVRDLRATGFLAEQAADVPRYLAPPEVTVKLWEEGANDPKTLLVGPSRETKGGAGAVAAVAGRGPVALVPGATLQDLARGIDDLRDKSLFPSFELADVKQATVVAADKRVAVERTGESDWRLTEPPQGQAREGAVMDVLLALKSLRWKNVVSPRGDEAARYGLDRPEVEVTLVKKDGTEIGALQVGKQDGDVTYVRLKASPTIYAIDSKAVAELRKAPTQIPG
jgi:hypothetical protein